MSNTRASQQDNHHDIQNKNMYLPKNIGTLMKQKSMNASQLAHALGLPLMTIGRLLSGKTKDPRLSTLKVISDYFKVSIDVLIKEDINPKKSSTFSSTKTYTVPKFTWDNLSLLKTIEDLDFNNWDDWQSVSLKDNNIMSQKSFALESRPSMYPRFPQDTVFVIVPDLVPTDRDLILIKFKENGECTLRELLIDPPEKRLLPLIEGSKILILNDDIHEIIGVCCLTILYGHKIKISK